MSPDISRNATYSSAQVACLVFARDVEWFYSYRNHEGRLDQFPRPISAVGRPRWHGGDLLDWLARPKQPVQAASRGTVVDLDRVRATLRDRSRKLARRLAR